MRDGVSKMARAAMLAMAVLLSAGCASVPVAPSSQASVRVVAPLMNGWRFHDGAQPVEAASPAYDDSGWQTVSLPHSWNALGEYGPKRTNKTRNRQGEGWYRLTLDGGSLDRSKRHFLEFDGVGNVADVWVNGVHVARHAGAFSRFRVDITDKLIQGQLNVVAIRADNSSPAIGSTTQDIIPLRGDFFIHGGLYRPVSLISVGPAHIDLLDHGGPGVYVRTASVQPGQAQVVVSTRLARANVGGLTLSTQIRDGEGRIVAVSRAAADTDTVTQQIKVPNPRLWDGRTDPHLYSASVELIERGRVIDRVEQKFGIRTFRFDPDKGFFLNGRHLALHGVSRHQDYLDRGWALSSADHARDMAIIEELGANTVRMAHYQHAEDWFALSDSSGMVAWAELPFVNKLSHSDSPATPELVANAREQLIELIRQNYNHPSVVTWSIGNETDIDLAFGRLGRKADPTPLLDQLHALARAEDPDRPTAIADCCEDTPSVKIEKLPVLAGHADLMGYNRYFGWYYGKTADLGPHLDRLHAKHPSLPISVSEYGAGAALSQHSDNPEGGPINAGGRPHPEEFQSWYHEQSWPQLRARPYLYANWIWNMFDFSSTVRNEGDATDVNDKGLVTFDRKIRKDAFYYYQAQWRDDLPVLHITGRRYVERAYPVTDVRIYSNLDRVSLFLNGTSAGSASCIDRVCLFRGVRLKAGANRVEVRGDFGGRPVVDAVDWNAPDASAGLSIKVGDLVGFKDSDGRVVGSDNWFSGGSASRIATKDAEAIQGAGDPRYRTSLRSGQFTYAIPLPNGRWRVTATFVAPKEEQQPFTVAAEGTRVLSIGKLPAKNAVQRSFDLRVRDGVLNLDFGPSATLSALEVRPLRP